MKNVLLLVFIAAIFSAQETIHAEEAIFETISKAYANKIDPADLGVQSSRYNGLVVEVGVNCFVAGLGDIRCVTETARVDFSALYPDEAEESLREKCGSIARLREPRCRRTVRFFYAGYESINLGGAMVTVVHPRAGAGVVVSKTTKR